MEIGANGGGWGRHHTPQGNSYWGLVWWGGGGVLHTLVPVKEKG